MPMTLFIWVLIAAVFIIQTVVFVLYLRHVRSLYVGQIQQLNKTINSSTKTTAAQRSTIKGQLAEQMYPLMSDCPYRLSDMRFMGDFCDYIAVDGYTDCKDGGDNYINNIVFVEIKTGKSQLSRHQKLIRDAVHNGRVRWETVHIP